MTGGPTLQLFQAYGIEIEYMIVDATSLSVRALADEVLRAAGGGYDMDVELGPIAWSNELALHVIELKTNGPAATLRGLGATFQEHVQRVEQLLEPLGARLMPTGMHPWMSPDHELRLWPHENNVIYGTFDRIFNCKGHGWANLQSTHINLPFADDHEFGRLHAAIRMILPLIPGIAASSPFVDGARTDFMDTRLEVYSHNAARVPSVAGAIVPERIFTRADYEGHLLQRIYDDLAPYDPEGVLRNEWVNARGCIARFDRMAIEIRLLDTQECPRADIAIAAAVAGAVRALVEERWSSFAAQCAWDEAELGSMLGEGIRRGDRAMIRNRRYLRSLGLGGDAAAMGDVWQHLIEACVPARERDDDWNEFYRTLDHDGCLARRIQSAMGARVSKPRLQEIYTRVSDCLRAGELFRPDEV